jgi:hypothetical protein
MTIRPGNSTATGATRPATRELTLGDIAGRYRALDFAR